MRKNRKQISSQQLTASIRTALAGLVVAVLLTGCQGIDLAQTPVTSVELSGVWTVDAMASDDLRAYTSAL